MLIVGARVSQNANDKQELAPDLESVAEDVFKSDAVLVDSGFYSEEAVAFVLPHHPCGSPRKIPLISNLSDCKSDKLLGPFEKILR